MVLGEHKHTCPTLGSLEPMFWISGDISSGFQIFAFYGGECISHSPRLTSGATPTDLLTASMASLHARFPRGRILPVIIPSRDSGHQTEPAICEDSHTNRSTK